MPWQTRVGTRSTNHIRTDKPASQFLGTPKRPTTTQQQQATTRLRTMRSSRLQLGCTSCTVVSLQKFLLLVVISATTICLSNAARFGGHQLPLALVHPHHRHGNTEESAAAAAATTKTKSSWLLSTMRGGSTGRCCFGWVVFLLACFFNCMEPYGGNSSTRYKLFGLPSFPL